MARGDRPRRQRSVDRVKIAVIGGGGFRAPLVWESVASVASEVAVDELVLHDVSRGRLAKVSSVIEGLRRERGGGPATRATTALPDAVDGAGVVFCAIRVGGLEARIVDETVPLRAGVLGQETVGPGGICFALRTLPVILDIAETVRARAPGCWFVNFTNPAGLVTEALREVMGDRVVGICDSPAALCARVGELLGRGRDDLEFDYVGLNHLGWLVAVRDGDDDLLPAVLADDRASGLEEARLFGLNRLRALGMIPNEYLVYYERPAAIVDAFIKAGETRAQTLARQEASFYDAPRQDPAQTLRTWRRVKRLRFSTYMAEAWGGTDSGDGDDAVDDGQDDLGYAGIAAAFVRATSDGRPDALVLNVPNRGRIDVLDDDAVVETACAVTHEGPRLRNGASLPSAQAELVATVKSVERMTISAATERSRALALDALAAHPLVPSRRAAEEILSGYLSALPDLAARLS